MREALKRATAAAGTSTAREGSEVTPVDRREPSVTPTYAKNRVSVKRHAYAAGREQARPRRSTDASQAENRTRAPERGFRRAAPPPDRSRPTQYASKPGPEQVRRERRTTEQRTTRMHESRVDASRLQRTVPPRREEEERRGSQARLLKQSKAPTTYSAALNPRKRTSAALHSAQPTTKRSKVPPKPPMRSSGLLSKSRSRLGSGAVGSFASKYAASSGVAPTGSKSYRSGAVVDLSGFSRPYRGGSSSVQPTVKSFGSSWQARVSTVPRPSVTPAQFQPVKRKPRPGINPVAPRR